MITDFEALIHALEDRDVDFVIVGAVALVLHGSARVTRDLDIAYARNEDNLRRLSAALQPFSPRLRGAPPDLPFKLDVPTLRSGLNFTLTTSVGDIDLLGELLGIGGFALIERFATSMTVYEREVQVLSLDGLERAKRAAGRLKDLVDLSEILELRRQHEAQLQAAADTVDSVLLHAIAERRLIQFTYNGRERVAEPHDYGIHKGVSRALVYQLQTSPGETDTPIGWRLLDTAKIEAPVVLDTTFRASRGAAHRNHYTWDKVHARVG